MGKYKNGLTLQKTQQSQRIARKVIQVRTFFRKNVIYMAVLILAISLSACGKSEQDQMRDSKQTTPQEPTQEVALKDEMLTAYELACSYADSGDYDAALPIFEDLKDYEDSNRHADGIRGIDIADELITKETAKYFNLTLVGMDVSCVYYPENYTFLEVWEVPEDGLYGILTGMASTSSGEEVSYDEAGLKRLAEGLYFDYFFPNYPGIICVLEMRDNANNKTVQGSFSGYDDVPSSSGLSVASIDDIQQYASQRDYIIQDGTLIEYSGNDSILEIPEGVSDIAEYVFSYNENIEAVYMPSTLKHISEGAFYCCEHLSEIYLSEGLESIGQLAFYGTDISAIEIPKTVSKIYQDDGNYSPFDFCLNLETIYFNGTMDQWKEMNVRIGNGSRQNTIVYCEDGELTPELQHATNYEDNFTGIFLDAANGVNIIISALSDDYTGEITYYLNYVGLDSEGMVSSDIPVYLEDEVYIDDKHFGPGFDANIWFSSSDYVGYILMVYQQDGACYYCPVIWDSNGPMNLEDIDKMKEMVYRLDREDAVG